LAALAVRLEATKNSKITLEKVRDEVSAIVSVMAENVTAVPAVTAVELAV